MAWYKHLCMISFQWKKTEQNSVPPLQKLTKDPWEPYKEPQGTPRNPKETQGNPRKPKELQNILRKIPRNPKEP